MTVIREAGMHDIEATLALWRHAAGASTLPTDAESVSALLSTEGSRLLVAEEAGEIVGSLIVGWDGWRCNLYKLAVHTDSRRRGLATALVERARVHAKELGIRRLDALVADDNDAAQRFWESVGFARRVSSSDRWMSPITSS